jgi:hypothetical protein
MSLLEWRKLVTKRYRFSSDGSKGLELERSMNWEGGASARVF